MVAVTVGCYSCFAADGGRGWNVGGMWVDGGWCGSGSGGSGGVGGSSGGGGTGTATDASLMLTMLMVLSVQQPLCFSLFVSCSFRACILIGVCQCDHPTVSISRVIAHRCHIE